MTKSFPLLIESPSYFEIILSNEEKVRILKNNFRSCAFSRCNPSFSGYLEIESFVDETRSSDFISFEALCEDHFLSIFERLTEYSQRIRYVAA